MKNTETTAPLAQRITQRPVGIPNHAYRIQELAAPFRTVADLDMTGSPREEREANVALILEAFTVCHETGRTPRQLAAERAELITALKGIAGIAGNLTDALLESKTGPNDAVARGIMVTSARSIAVDALNRLTP